MSAMLKARESFFDFKRIGFKFFVSGVLAEWSRNKTVAVNLPHGRKVLVRTCQSDFSTLRQVFRDQEYRIPDSAADRFGKEYDKICASGDVPIIVDAGANIGSASVWFKARFPNATIIAIEPDPDNAAMTRKNLAEFDNIIVLEAAIGGEPGFVSIAPAEHAWAVQTERADTGCAVVTIDQAVAMVPSGKLFIAKIDIEGFESDLFAGDVRWMDDVFGVFIEPHDWMLPDQASSRSFQAEFGKRDFDIFLCGENLMYVRRCP